MNQRDIKYMNMWDMTPHWSDPLNLEIVEWNYPLMGDVWQIVFVERDY